VRAQRARRAVVVLVIAVLALLVALCSVVVPPSAASPCLRVVAHAAMTAASGGSTSVPSGHAKKGVSLSSVGWAVLAVVVLAAAVATPLALRRHRDRTAENPTTDDD
jgi:hypothetical protein